MNQCTHAFPCRYVVINSAISLFQQHPPLHATVWMAVERAVDEIINPVVDRSIKIACISSQKLILKDFALEADEGRLREAAHHVVRHLAGSLVMVTAKDPVRMSIGSHLRQLLMSSLPPEIKANPQSGALVDQAIQAATNDNLALACAFIEKTAMERAVPEVDELLKDAYAQRIQFRESRNPGPFLDSKNYGTGVSTLPPALRPKPGGLDPGQLALYVVSSFLRNAHSFRLIRALTVGPKLTSSAWFTKVHELPQAVWTN
jgi:CCR4-NOT transcription complex subunit 1